MPEHKESFEDYLEKILMIKNRNGHVRSIDVANELSFSKASVSIAMKKLKENDYISIDDNGYITLLKKGLNIASSVLERHNIISQALIYLGVDPKVASEDACKIEHDISDETMNAIKKHFKNKIK